MRVLHVITGLDAGGAEIQLASLLERTRHDAEVVALYNPGPIADRIRASGTVVHSVGMRSNTDVTALIRLSRIIRAGRYDVVHAHLYRSQIYARPAARLMGVPVVLTTEHSIGETHIERRPMTLGVRSLYLVSELFSDATIAVSDVVRERLIRWGVPRRKITVVPNGVEASQLSFDEERRARVREQFGIAEDAYVIGSLGRLDSNKRVDLAIEAAAPYLGDGCKMLVIGRGEDLAHLEATTERLGVGEHVIFGGFQSDSASMFAAFDLYVAASAQEAFGISVLEALASGLPVLYTTCPALDGIETVRAVMVAGSVEAMRAAIGAQLAQRDRARTVPMEVFAAYDMTAVAERIDDLYETILSTRPRRVRAAAARRSASSPVPPPPSAKGSEKNASAKDDSVAVDLGSPADRPNIKQPIDKRGEGPETQEWRRTDAPLEMSRVVPGPR